jgi:uncharacterized membrane protein YgcG
MNDKKRFLAFLGAITACIALAAIPHAHADSERIISFQSDITVREDSVLQVTERIVVRSLGDSIKRGIYRDFPTTYRDRFGFNRIVGFEVASVLRDGQPENYRVESEGNGKRVYIGRVDVVLDPGVYQYSITYTTTRQIAFAGDHNELYWNVTGNNWSFPIGRAEARVRVPAGARDRILSAAGWTGPVGSIEQDYISETGRDGTVHFISTRELAPGEGLTISVKWPRGFVAEPTEETLREEFLRDNRGIIAGFGGLLAVLCYYLVVWIIAGRDPRPGTIIPLYAPPDGLSPAGMRFISEMGYDHRIFAAAVINMAVKGYLSIHEDDGEYTLKKEKSDEKPLSADEKKISSKLFGGRDSIVLKTENHSMISGAITALKKSLSLTYEKQYFVRNLRYFVPGLLLSVAALVYSFIMVMTESPEHFILIWLSFWSIAVIFLLVKVASSWKEALSKKSHRVINTAGALFFTAFSLPFFAAEIFVLGYYLTIGPPWMLLNVLGVLLLNYVFYRLLKAPTRAGRRLLDRVEGFRLYLTVAEKDRLETVTPPEKTVATFERFLPYALALGVENSWAEYFSGVLNVPGPSGSTYSPRWYTGSSWSSMGASGFASSFGNSFASAVSSSSTAPGRGSGGGGSSGGGGGGGGGGGW